MCLVQFCAAEVSLKTWTQSFSGANYVELWMYVWALSPPWGPQELFSASPQNSQWPNQLWIETPKVGGFFPPLFFCVLFMSTVRIKKLTTHQKIYEWSEVFLVFLEAEELRQLPLETRTVPHMVPAAFMISDQLKAESKQSSWPIDPRIHSRQKNHWTHWIWECVLGREDF